MPNLCDTQGPIRWKRGDGIRLRPAGDAFWHAVAVVGRHIAEGDAPMPARRGVHEPASEPATAGIILQIPLRSRKLTIRGWHRICPGSPCAQCRRELNLD